MVMMAEGGAELTSWGGMTRSMVRSTRSLREEPAGFYKEADSSAAVIS